MEKNNSYYENYERTSIKNNGIRQLINMNLPDKYMILSSMKKSSKLLFSDLIEEKRISPKKISSVNTTGFNLKTAKNANKKNEISILSKPNYFVKTGLGYSNKSNGGSNILFRESLRTHSFKENDKQKEQQKNIAKSKTHSKYPQIKSSSGNILINNINLNKDTKNDNNNTLQYNSSKKNNNSVIMKINSGKKNNNNNIGRNNNNNKMFLKKHIVIESKNKNMMNDNRKNNNSINSNNNKNNNAEGK
jgi:hypothetical protein